MYARMYGLQLVSVLSEKLQLVRQEIAVRMCYSVCANDCMCCMYYEYMHGMHACMHVCMYVSMHACIYVYH